LYVGKYYRQAGYSDVVNAVGLVVIQAKTVITDEHINLIHKHHVDPLSIMVVEATQEESSQTNSQKLTQQIVDHSKDLFESIKHEKKVPIADFKTTVIPAIEQISNDPNIFRLFEAVRARDDYTHQHNIGVGVLSTLIGRWLNLGEDELSALSLAATLHDLGKVKIPLEILHKPGKLTNEEFQLIKQHPVFGYEMLEKTAGINQKLLRLQIFFMRCLREDLIMKRCPSMTSSAKCGKKYSVSLSLILFLYLSRTLRLN
jgi:HD-GYP domain-containing protein (c-di-GMP phosphodiesterase class II)